MSFAISHHFEFAMNICRRFATNPERRNSESRSCGMGHSTFTWDGRAYWFVRNVITWSE